MATYGAGTDAALETLLAPTTDFTKLEPGEAKPGGEATSRGSVDTPNAFSLSSGNMDFKRELDFKVGNGIFRKNWVSAPSSTDSSDGLGPLFNSRACQNCHLKDGRGHPPLSSDVPDDSGSMLVRLSVPPATDEERALLDAHKVNSLPDPTYGGQLQDFAIQGFASEGKLKIGYKERKVKLAGGETVNLRVPTYSLTDLNYGPASPDIMISPRVAPQMIGLGLLEAVPEEQILGIADPDDANKDGISGKPNEVWSREHAKLMLGRFGWKAGIPTIAQQAAEAFNGDIGLSTTMIPKGSGDCTEKEKACLDAPSGDIAALSECRGGRRPVRHGRVLFQEPRRAGAPQARRCRGAEGQGAVLPNRLHQLPQAEIHDRRCAGPAAFVAPADLSLYRYAAPRHGRGACRQSARGRGQRERVAHGAALGHRADRHCQRPHAVPA